MEIAKLSIREKERLYLNGEEIKNIISYQIEHEAGNDAVLTVTIPVDMSNLEGAFSFSPSIETSIWIPADQYDRIMIFKSEDDLKEAVNANPHLVCLFEDRPLHKTLFPNVFLAGVKRQTVSEKKQKGGDSMNVQEEIYRLKAEIGRTLDEAKAANERAKKARRFSEWMLVFVLVSISVQMIILLLIRNL